MIVTKNTYPEYPNVPHAEPGDEVYWQRDKTADLIRQSDGKTVFSTAPVDRDGLLRSNRRQPVLTGIIAQVKSKGWILEIKI